MKMPLLPVSFAVAVMASAADLKDPAQVAFEWAQPKALAWVTDLSLKGQTRHGFRPNVPPPLLSFDYGKSPTGLSFDRHSEPPRPRSFPKPVWPILRDKIYDAPNYRVPDVLPDNMPPGTKLWRYGGGTYYLLPLIPAREK